jgi:hypothetical protein
MTNRQVLMPAEGIQELLGQREPIQQEAQGKVPDGLAQAAVMSVMRLARNERPARVLSPRVLQLVRCMLRRLSQEHGKPDTALFLRKRIGEPGA